MFRGSVKGTGYPRHSSVSPSLPLPGVTLCHHISTGLYIRPKVAVMPLKQYYSNRCHSYGIYYPIYFEDFHMPFYQYSCIRTVFFHPQITQCNIKTKLTFQSSFKSLISKFRSVLYVVLFLLGDSPASEFNVSAFRTSCLFHLNRRCKEKESFFLLTPSMKMEKT